VRSSALALATLAVVTAGATLLLVASDHSDSPTGITGARVDANISDLHAFVSGPNLVLAVSTNTGIPPSATSYVFPTDVTFEINIDHNSAVSPADPNGDGGTILAPDKIQEDITFRIRFAGDGSAKIQRLGPDGLGAADPGLVNFFAGLRDDPFIRGPRQGRNVGAFVLEVPLASVLAGQSTLLIWATSKVEDFDGPIQEITGRSLKSMFPENSLYNTMHPRHHQRRLGKSPDVMIYNTALPAAFPNGRLLTDDVVDLVGDNRVLANDAPFPSTNDKPFLSTFPYLAPPH
jgi:hypothetical protein